MALEPVNAACIGMGWWSDVLADAIVRSAKLNIVACYTRSEPKHQSFAAKYGEWRRSSSEPAGRRREGTPRAGSSTPTRRAGSRRRLA